MILSNPAWLSAFNFIFGLLELGINILTICVLIMTVPWQYQGPSLVVLFILACVSLGEVPAPKIFIRNWRTRIRRGCFNVRRWLLFQRYLHVQFSRDAWGNFCGIRAEVRGSLGRRIRKSKRVKLRHYRHRRLAPSLVARCRRQRSNLIPTLDGRLVPTQCSRRHRRWQGRNRKAKHRLWVRRVVNNEFFLNGMRRHSSKLHRAEKSQYCDWVPQPVRDFNAGGIDEKTLDEFCKSTEFLALPKFFQAFRDEDHKERAQIVVNRYNGHRSSLFLTKVLEAQYSEDDKAVTSDNFIFCPLVWDTGASYGLTPFRDDFIDYEEVEIEVQDIAHKNKVVGVGTVRIERPGTVCGCAEW